MSALFILLAILISGCATGGAHVTVGTTLTPAQEAGLAEVKAFVEATARAYRVQPPVIMVGDHAGDATFGAVYRRGVIVFTSRMLTSPSRDKITAHEPGHYVLRHDQPSSLPREVREHQANIEAVRILQTAKGLSEEAALREVVEALDRSHRAQVGLGDRPRPRASLRGDPGRPGRLSGSTLVDRDARVRAATVGTAMTPEFEALARLRGVVSNAVATLENVATTLRLALGRDRSPPLDRGQEPEEGEPR